MPKAGGEKGVRAKVWKKEVRKIRWGYGGVEIRLPKAGGEKMVGKNRWGKRKGEREAGKKGV